MDKNIFICGLSYGDEGKGKITNFFADSCKGVVRFSGGPNAGHTVYVGDKKYILHHLPSGIVKGKPVYLEPGMVIDIDRLIEEAKPFNSELIHICGGVHIITTRHLEKDSSGNGIGTTKRGVGPCYESKMARKGIRVKDLPSDDRLMKHFPLYGFKKFDSGYLFEGAQGIMLDVDYGHYPYVTSSSIMPSS